MQQDYTVEAAISSNLEDALEELVVMSEMFRPHTKVDESEFKVRIAHLYSHLNTAWNVRNASEADLASADSGRVNAWSRFPTDLHPFL